MSHQLKSAEQSLPALFRRLVADHGLTSHSHERALLLAPFGKFHFAEAVKSLKSSEVVRRLAEEGYFRVIVLTDRESDSGAMPAYCRVIRFGEVPGWADTPVRRARFFKWAAPFLFPRIRVSLYVDSNFNFTGRVGKMYRLFDDITTHGSLVTRHEARRGWEDEYRQILRCGRSRNRRLLELQRDYYALEGLSGEIPLCQTGMLGRDHGNPANRLSLPVLAHLRHLSERDQLALPFAQGKTGLSFHPVPEGKYLYTGVAQRLHPESVCLVHRDHLFSFRVRWWQHRVRRGLGRDLPGASFWDRAAGYGRVQAVAGRWLKRFPQPSW